MANLVNEMRLL